MHQFCDNNLQEDWTQTRLLLCTERFPMAFVSFSLQPPHMLSPPPYLHCSCLGCCGTPPGVCLSAFSLPLRCDSTRQTQSFHAGIPPPVLRTAHVSKKPFLCSFLRHTRKQNQRDNNSFLKLTAISSNLPNSSVRYLSIGGLMYSQ